MLKNYHFKTLLVVCLMTIFGGVSAWGATNTYTYTFSKLSLTTGQTSYNLTLDGVDWTLSSSAAINYFGFDTNTTNKGLQIGAGSVEKASPDFTFSTTEIAGKITSITVNASTAKSASATLTVKVNDTQYGDTKDLTKTATDYTFTGSETGTIEISYAQTTSKALYIKSITVVSETVDTGKEAAGITFGATVGETPSYVTTLAKNFTAPTLTNPNSLPIEYTSSNEDVATVGTDGKITLQGNGTTTITAHTEGDATHDPGDAKYTIKVLPAINGLEGLYAAGVITTDEQEYLLTLTDAVVTYNNGKNTYIQDANRGMLIYSSTDKPIVGKKISGEVIVKAKAYNNLYELTAFDASDDATITGASAEERQPAVATIAQILASPKSYESKYIKIVDATVESAFDNQNSVIYQKDGDTKKSITMRASSATLTSKVGDIITVTGFPAVYNETQQFTVWSQEDIVSAIKYFKYSAESFEAKIGVANTFPKLTNDYDETPTYSSSHTNVATINTEGVVTLVAPGTTIITATLASAGKSASYELTVSELQSYAYTRVNDASEIVDGGKYILVATPAEAAPVALTAREGTKQYYSPVTLTSACYYYGATDIDGKPYELTLEASDVEGQYYIKCDGEYLQGEDGTSLTFLSSKPASTNKGALWTVNLSDEKADIQNVGTTERYLGFNPATNSLRFSTYKSSNLASSRLYRRYNKTGEGSVTIATTEGFGTLYSDKAVVIPEGLTATTVKAAADGQLTMDWEYAAGNTVPANTGLLIQGENGITYDFITTDNAVELSTANLLSGSATAATTVGDAGSKFYKLTYSEVNSEQVLGFFWGAENGAAFTNEAGKAYLVIPAGSEANGFRLDGSAITGINNVALDRAADKIYTISGVAVSAQQGKLPAGLYIVNGQKQIVK